MIADLTLSEEVSAWKALEANVAFQFLVGQIRDQIRLREGEIFHGVLTPENIYDREKLRGERAGMEQVLVMYQTIKEEAEIALEKLIKEQQNGTDQQKSV